MIRLVNFATYRIGRPENLPGFGRRFEPGYPAGTTLRLMVGKILGEPPGPHAPVATNGTREIQFFIYIPRPQC